MPNKVQFLKRILRHRLQGQPRTCPYCEHATALTLLRRKKLVLEVLKCESCKLVFRWPKDTQEDASAYYQDQFAKEFPQVELPSSVQLQDWMRSSFAGTPLDLSPEIEVLRALRPVGRVLDYGCSWGYGTHQLRQRGYEAVGFEISRCRTQFARQTLGLAVFDTPGELRALPAGAFDIVFSHHVLEHLMRIQDAFDLFAHLVADDGLLFHALPNFTGRLARTGLWLAWIGEEHPIAPTIEFFAQNLPRYGFTQVQFASSPFDADLAAILRQQNGATPQVEGDELLVVAQRVT